jgi:intraflagellar transport protein 172
MQIKYWGNLQQPQDAMQKISAIAWSPNSKRQAVAASDRVIHLYDETGQKRDKFSIRPLEKDNKSYIVRALAFSPDS